MSERRTASARVLTWLFGFLLAIVLLLLLLSLLAVRETSTEWLPRAVPIPISHVHLPSSKQASNWNIITFPPISLRTPLTSTTQEVKQYDELRSENRSILFLVAAPAATGVTDTVLAREVSRICDGSAPAKYDEFTILEDIYSFDSDHSEHAGEYRRFLRMSSKFLRKPNVKKVVFVEPERDQVPLRLALYYSDTEEQAWVDCDVYTGDGCGLASILFRSAHNDVKWILQACATIRLIESEVKKDTLRNAKQ